MGRCPVCDKVVDGESVAKPFCSKRCKDVDLYKWFSEGYSVPVEEYDDIDEEEMEELVRIVEKEEV